MISFLRLFRGLEHGFAGNMLGGVKRQRAD
jgi:hypothetical protein